MSKENLKNKTSIGGQAVLEGVMMRGKTAKAVAVRDEDGIIRLEAERIVPPTKKNKFFSWPIVRGVVSFFDSMVGGMKTMMRSAEVYGEGEPSKVEKWMAEKLKINLMNVVMAISLILGLGLAIGLFFVLPTFLTGLMNLSQKENPFLYTLVEGLVRIVIFILYILLTSLLKDIKRTYMYHGAEHKTISCYEKGLELTVENVRKCPRVHDRCGTTFMFFVIFVGIIVFCLVNPLLADVLEDNFTGKLVRILVKIALLPLVSGLSYELLKALAKTSSWIVYPLKLPGLLLQRITTREPDDEMIEVAITSFTKVLKMDEDPNEPECKFVTAMKLCDLTADIKAKFAANGIDESDAEWLVAIGAGVTRSMLSAENFVSPKNVEKIMTWAIERIDGKPLAYVVGDVDFFGYTIKVDGNVLIPRPETEELVYNVCKYVSRDSKVLDLCTGSGAIAVVINKKTDATVFASDVSEDALRVAEANAKLNDAPVTFIHSDLFNDITENFDVIVSNPPYIRTADIDALDSEVKDYEPRMALDGGEDGLDFYRRIAEGAYGHLSKGGMLFLECGYDQAEDITVLLGNYSNVEIIKDINGVDRIIKAVK